MKRGTPRHPKTKDLARRLKIPIAHAVGILEMLWHYAADFAPRGDIGRLTNADIADAVGWPEEDCEVIIQALLESGWLNLIEGPDRIAIHDWHEHADDYTKKKIKDSGKSWASLQKILENSGKFCPTIPNLTVPNHTPPEPVASAPKRKTPAEEIDLAATAVKLHQRHPANGCGISEIKKHLKAIVGKSSTDKRAEILELIDRNHAAWCETQGWRDGYAKGLANWLSPKMERWKDPPSENRQMRKSDWTATLETADERWARLEREDAAKAAQTPARGIL